MIKTWKIIVMLTKEAEKEKEETTEIQTKNS